MQPIPEDALDIEMEDEEEKQNPEERISIRASEKRICNENELSDSEDEGDNRRDNRTYKKPKKSKPENSSLTLSDSKPVVTEKKESEPSSNEKSSNPTATPIETPPVVAAEPNSTEEKK